jgi:hypothetical protein
MVDAMVEVRHSQTNMRLGEHDMIMELVSDGRGGVPKGLSGHLSVELKCRRLWSESGREQVRREIRDEACDTCCWWQGVQSEFAGRLIIRAVFTERAASSEKFELRADLKLNSEGQWRGLFGWPDAGEEKVVLARCLSMAMAAPKAAVAKAVPKAALAKAAPKAAVAKAVAKSAADRGIRGGFLDRLTWQGGACPFEKFLDQVRKE